MALDLSGVESAISALVPNTNDVLQSVVTSAAAGVVLSGLKNQLGNGQLDPLGLFPHPANNPNAIAGPTITASAFAALDATTKAQLMAAGAHIVAG